MTTPHRRSDRRANRPWPPLLLRICAIGVATAMGIVGSWYAAHELIRFEWPEGNAMAREALHDLPARWADGTLPGELDRLYRSVGVLASVYDTRGGLVASSARPPLPAPTAGQQREAVAHRIKTHLGPVVIDVRRGETLLGFCVLNREFPPPPLRGVLIDLLIMSTWISAVGYLTWRTLVRPLQRIARAAEAFGVGNVAARTGVDRKDEIGQVARAFDDMSERIARSREAERELMASLSHELRTPMARIRVALDLAAESDADTVRSSLADVAEDMTELETLMSNIFSTTRLKLAATAREDDQMPLQRADVECSELVEKAVAHLRAQHPDRPYQLELAPGVQGRSTYADPILVRRAIENVLENAHKYSPPGAPITVIVAPQASPAVTGAAGSPSTHNGAEVLRIAVNDRGFGIRPNDLPRVFTPFFRADRSRTRATGGVGLGLTFAKRVVEAHGGSIDITSQVDAGTTVTFVLPIGPPPPPAGNPMRNIP